MNAIGQRTGVSQAGTAFQAVRSTAWGYDSLGQVTKADSTIPGLDRAYQYDMIGNRLKSAESLTLPASDNYTANSLNQYTAIGANTPSYDDDGNATAYPLPADTSSNSTLVWDAENRLIEVQEAGTSVPLVRFVYDSQSRRIAKTEGTETTLYLYDGWNPIWRGGFQPLVSSTTVIEETYLWGTDLSGTMQGAGGVGGLLSVSQGGSAYYPTYDGNGNVSEYLDSTGAVVAHYEYDPFGRITVATGSKVADFSHRFSTKPLDFSTGLYYYGYRYYDPETGRWPSRDPIGELGGTNLYEMVSNNAISSVDVLGLASTQIDTTCGKKFDECDPTVDEIKEFIKSLPEDCMITEMEFNGHGMNDAMELNQDEGEMIELLETIDADGDSTFKVSLGGDEFTEVFDGHLDKDSKIHLDGCYTGCTGPINGSDNNLAKVLSEKVPGTVSGSKGLAFGNDWGRPSKTNPSSVVGVRGTYKGGKYIGGKFAK